MISFLSERMTLVGSRKNLCWNLWYSTDKRTRKDDSVLMMLLFRAVKMTADCEKLQEDSAKLSGWARYWQVKFSVGGHKVRETKIPHTRWWVLSDQCHPPTCETLGHGQSCEVEKGSSVKNINFSFNSGYKSKYQKEPKYAENTTWLPCKHMFLLLLEWHAALFLHLKKVQQGKFGGWKGWHKFSKAGLTRVVCSLGWKGTEGLGTPWGLPRVCRNKSKTSGSDCRLCPASRTREVSAHFYRARLQMA